MALQLAHGIDRPIVVDIRRGGSIRNDGAPPWVLAGQLFVGEIALACQIRMDRAHIATGLAEGHVMVELLETAHGDF